MRILITDDHPIVRKGLRQIIIEGIPNSTIHEAGDAEFMINELMREKFDVLVCDLSLPGRSALESLAQIKKIDPALPILIISIFPEDQYAIRAIKAGASGYLTKDSAPEDLVLAITTVFEGKKYITASIAEKMLSNIHMDNSIPLHFSLSEREFSVFRFLVKGHSISEIADFLFVSPTTVSTYRSRILSKLNLKNNNELLLYSIEYKLFDQQSNL